MVMLTEELLQELRDPFKMQQAFWPDVIFYKQQRMMIESVRDNDETFVPAGNMLGKDFTSAFIILHFFLTRSPCRIVTTSAKDDHLRVLWGEISRFIQTSLVPLDYKKGGPLIQNHHDIRKLVGPDYKVRCPLSYLVGMVAGADSIAAMQGHHVANVGDGVPRTLFVCDESSSVRDEYAKMARTWCNRFLAIGNTWPCNNFFRHAVEGKPGSKDQGGDLPRGNGLTGYYRKVIHIRAVDSPNVRLGMAQSALGENPTGEVLIPGVKSWQEYCKNLATWDDIQKAVGLEAKWYHGPRVYLFPRKWLRNSARLAKELGRAIPGSNRLGRKAKAIGCDPGEGGANTCWSVVDELGLMEQVSMKTPDTSIIEDVSIELMKKWNVQPRDFVFDRGGGGKQIADSMRKHGYKGIRTVAFGEALSLIPRRGQVLVEERVDNMELRSAYFNRRAEMYGELRELINPLSERKGFAIPEEYEELFRQLAPIPLTRDGEGRLYLLPKGNRKSGSTTAKNGSKVSEETLLDLLGCSPDEADSLVLAVHAMLNRMRRPKAGAGRQ